MKALQRAGFYKSHQTGSHIQLRHPQKTALRITIPFRRSDLAPKTLKTIIKQADLSLEEFIKLLK
ncbi:MAG: addiction module toxin, HicA family [Candidatus Harrisonbacteria bacterium CG10_big_fil_rev_8_21_14_0_10_38_8]|uniref:Addiction module toxin, HicA family n=1 Tax=Candidatus Harrisonbacteria bacterium CG10_big_fil_rev_8_21_14_0_10_38_8 TaxID=1974582 RepID=A0A2M6WJZ5_9BACT|nr:MAG: addiction module toxin, HicA family [Candidatus Harrisonbacteria bacterium CG10_big_fil_rev_8_21_14_0_10_38_8]